MSNLTDEDLLKAIESGLVPIGFLYRHKTTSKDGTCSPGEWEWYEPGSPGHWHRGPTFRTCMENLLRRD